MAATSTDRTADTTIRATACAVAKPTSVLANDRLRMTYAMVSVDPAGPPSVRLTTMS